MFADVSRPLPMEGEEFFADGKPIRFGAGLRQVFPGDLIVIEWPVDQSFGTGNWVKGGVTVIDTSRANSKMLSSAPVFEATVHLAAGWHMGSFKSEMVEGEEGETRLVLVPQVKVANIPWHWSLRTDDVPSWNVFVIGHNCDLHDADAACLGEDRKRRAEEARAGEREWREIYKRE